VLIVLAIALPWLPIGERAMQKKVIDICTIVLTYIMLGWGLNIVVGLAGLLDLGYVAFYAVGAYTYAMLSVYLGWSFWACLPLAGLLAATFGVLLGFPVLRLRGHYLAVATLGLIFIVQGLAVNLDGYTRGALGLNGLTEFTNLWWVYGWMLVTLYVCWKLKHSSLGRTMLAVRENELAAACLGVRITRTRILSFALGAFFAGVAGGLWAHLVTLITPSSFSFLFAFQLVVMVVLGGTGSITGAALVSALLTVATEALHPVEEAMGLFGASQVLMALAVLLVLIFRPKGLFGMAEPDLLGWIGRSPGREPTRSGSKRQREV
jgi:branched-chain amino acid transport system permease protein